MMFLEFILHIVHMNYIMRSIFGKDFLRIFCHHSLQSGTDRSLEDRSLEDRSLVDRSLEDPPAEDRSEDSGRRGVLAAPVEPPFGFTLH